ncbi:MULTISPECIES: hypothetical protein [Kitasatospora]|uniref:Secreted protein n=1 Tax=Kitasatospora cystarginea TaxID=58350 RepID=A0ABN3DS09_9ACTN
MDAVLALVLGLGGTGLTAVFLLLRRERRRSGGDDPVGLLIERRRTAEAAHQRRIYSSWAVHHGNGFVHGDPYRPNS